MGDLFDKEAFGDEILSGVAIAGSYRKAARQCRVSPAALHKLALGRMMPSAEIYLRVRQWLDAPRLP